MLRAAAPAVAALWLAAPAAIAAQARLEFTVPAHLLGLPSALTALQFARLQAARPPGLEITRGRQRSAEFALVRNYLAARGQVRDFPGTHVREVPLANNRLALAALTPRGEIILWAGSAEAWASGPAILRWSKTPLLHGVRALDAAVSFSIENWLPGGRVAAQATLVQTAADGHLRLAHYREVAADRWGADRLVRDLCASTPGPPPAAAAWDPAVMHFSPQPCGSPPARRAIATDPLPVSKILQDSAGAIWATNGNAVFRWTANGWKPQAAPSGGYCQPRPTPQGTVEFYCGAPGAAAAGELPPVGSVPTSAGLLYVLPGTPFVLARWPGEHPQPLLTFSPSTLLSPDLCRVCGPSPGDLQSFRDDLGQTWIWAQNLNGLILVRGQQVTLESPVPGLPTPGSAQLPYLFVARWDASHIAVGVSFHGLYLINTHTLQATAVAPPRPHALDYTEMAVSHQGMHYILAVGRPLNHAERIWRFDGNTWNYVNVDWNAYGPPQAIEGDDGLWVAARQRGLWFIPRTGAAVHVGWEHGLPLDRVGTLLADGPGRLFASGEAGSSEFASSSLLVSKIAAPGVSAPEIPGRLTEDAQQKFWGLESNALAEWDGSNWRSFPLPAGVSPQVVAQLDPDNHGNVWLLPTCADVGYSTHPVAFQPATVTWRSFDDARTMALALAPDFHFQRPEQFLSVRRGPSGIVAYTSCDQTAKLEHGRWRISWVTPHLPPYHYRPQPPIPPAPPGCDTLWPESLAVDPAGHDWWTAGGNLYVGTAGNCRIVLAASSIQPFLDGRKLSDVRFDRRGNAVFDTSLGPVVVTAPLLSHGGVRTMAKPQPLP